MSFEDRLRDHLHDKGEAIIEISERDGIYKGVIVWSQKRPETVGTAVFRGLRYDSDDREWHGRAFSIKRQREVPIDTPSFQQGLLDALRWFDHYLAAGAKRTDPMPPMQLDYSAWKAMAAPSNSNR